MTDRLKGKVAIITGAGGGIGRAMARLFAREGATVMCLDISADNAEKTVRLVQDEGGKAEAHTIDLMRREDVRALFTRIDAAHGRLDILVNNAMWISYDRIADVTEDVVDRMFGIGLKALIWTTQAAEPMLERQGGSIINVASIAALTGSPDRIVYCAVKAGVTGITRASAVELGPKKIRVNAIAPGAVLFPATAKRLGPEGIELRMKTTPLRRLGEAEDMAKVSLFLASEDSEFVNGMVITVDGGRIITA
jgi:NAD(P)-dependent dehydrogenase (short-subunit alcohol dehydrogenase family)